MKIATFNIQNLFYRNRELIKRNQSKNASDWIAELDSLLKKKTRDGNDNARMRDLSFLLGFEKLQDVPYAILRKHAGELCFKNRGFENTTKASFLTDWDGWVKLGNIPLHEKAIFCKAYVIAETDPDILILQEVEDRASLMEFNTEFLPLLKISPFKELMVFETNESKGLGMGIMLKNGFKIDTFKNHLHDLDKDGFNLFDVDCQEYSIITPDGKVVYVISNHFTADEVQRKAQAEKVTEIYNQKRDEGKEYVIVCGTLNDVSYSDCLSPLIRETDLKDVSKHKNFSVDTDHGRDGEYFRLGAYRLGVNIKQKDYLMFSPALFKKIRSAGMNRKGTWPERKPNWSLYPSISGRQHAASEHPLIWGEIINSAYASE